MPPPLRLVTLGEPRLIGAGGGPLGRKDMALLAYVARHAPRAISRATLAALLWSDRDDARARHSLRTALLHVRRAAGDVLDVSNDAVRMVDGALALDATEFEHAVSAGRLAEASDAWAGDFLAGADDVGGTEWRVWLEAEREALRRRLAWALERLAERASAQGQWNDAVRWAERWTTTLPLDEPANRQLVQALRLAGRPQDALACHATFVARHRAVLGQEPSPAHMRLAERLRDEPRRAAPHRAAEPAAAGPRSAALLAPDFVGRAAEFAELTAAWATARRGDPAVVLVDGDEGLGKSRLCEELVRWVRTQTPRAVVLHARAYAAERAAPWTAARHLFAPLAEAPGVAAAPPETLARLADTVAPALRDRFHALPPVPSTDASAVDPGRETQATAEALRRALGEIVAETPVLLCLDDLPAADDATQAVLRALMRRPVSGVFQLYSACPDAAALAPELRGTAVRRIRLQPLAMSDLETMLASMLVLEPGARRRLAERLHADVGGNPFHVAETVAGLMDAGRLVMAPDGTWDVAAADGAERALPLPSSVRETVRERFGRLGAPARAVLDAAARLGGRASATQLGATAGLAPADVETALDELLARRLLREVGPDGYEFAHELTRRVASEAITPARVEASLGTRAARPPRARAGRTRLAAAVAFTTALGIGSWRVHGARETAAMSPDVVAVLPFSVRGDVATHGYLRDGLVDLLSVGLDGMGGVRAVDPYTVLAVAPPDAAPDLAAGQALARRVGAGAFVLGTAVTTAGTLRLSASLHDASGAARASATATGRVGGDITVLTDSLVRGLVAGRYGGPAEEITRVAVRTTPSAPALRAYLDGERLLRAGRFESAIAAYQTAVGADSMFALAYYRLGLAAEWAQRGELTAAASEHAARLGQRLAPRLRLLLDASRAQRAGDATTAAEHYRRILSRYPSDVEATIQYAELLSHHGVLLGATPPEAARDQWEKVLAVEPTNRFAILHLARLATALGDTAAAALHTTPAGGDAPVEQNHALELAALRAVALHQRAAEDSVRATLRRSAAPTVVGVAWPVLTVSRDLEASERFARLVVETKTEQAGGRLLLAYVRAARGQFRAATATLDSAAIDWDVYTVIHPAVLALLPYAPREGIDAMRRRVRAWHPPARSPTADVTWETVHLGTEPLVKRYLQGALAAAAGDRDAAVQQATSLQHDAADGVPGAPSLAYALAEELRARVALDGDLPRVDTVPTMRHFIAGVGQVLGSPLYDRSAMRWASAEALRRLGHDENALRWYRGFGVTSPFELPYVAPAALRQGEIFERLGQPREAVAAYERVVALWGHADSELQPIVADVRRRVQRLRDRSTAPTARP